MLSILTQFLSGKPDGFRNVAGRLGLPILGELPLAEGVSASADGGYSYVLKNVQEADDVGGFRWKDTMNEIAQRTAADLWKGP